MTKFKEVIVNADINITYRVSQKKRSFVFGGQYLWSKSTYWEKSDQF